MKAASEEQNYELAAQLRDDAGRHHKFTIGKARRTLVCNRCGDVIAHTITGTTKQSATI